VWCARTIRVRCEIDPELATTVDAEDTEVKSYRKRDCSSVSFVSSVVESLILQQALRLVGRLRRVEGAEIQSA
jgi:hypothetical protein